MIALESVDFNFKNISQADQKSSTNLHQEKLVVVIAAKIR